MKNSDKKRFVAAVKIAAQLLPVTSALAQWLSEIEASNVDERLAKLENPLSKYGDRIGDLTKELYSMLEQQPQDIATTHLDWSTRLEPFKKELRHLEAEGLLTGSHCLGPGGEFGAGLRLNHGLIVLLALHHGDHDAVSSLTEAIETTQIQLNGKKIREQINLPLTVIDAFFSGYAGRGQGLKSREIGASAYIPHT
jgi:hypothetical protein